MPAKERDYKKEYARDHSGASSKKDRASRNKVRAQMAKAGKVRKGDKKDVDHKDGNPKNNSKKNLQVMSRSKNRSKQ